MAGSWLHPFTEFVQFVMGSGADWTPGLGAYVRYCSAFVVRYFLVTGFLYWLFCIAFRERWRAYRIQPKFPAATDLWHDARWAVAHIATNGLSTLLVYYLLRSGQTRMYFDIGDFGWGYLVLTGVLMVVGYDTWNYWQHRVLHTPWWFERIHHIHHRSENPTSLTTFAQHPVETLLGNSYYVLLIMVVPLHPAAVMVASAYMFATGVNGHLGYELYPSGFTRHPFFGWINTSTHHNLHHSTAGCNYSSWFNWWDRLMGTNHPAYDEAFEAVKSRVAASSAFVPATMAGSRVLPSPYPDQVKVAIQLPPGD